MAVRRGQFPKAANENFMSAPSYDPDNLPAGMTPIMTYGEIAATPNVLEAQGVSVSKKKGITSASLLDIIHNVLPGKVYVIFIKYY